MERIVDVPEDLSGHNLACLIDCLECEARMILIKCILFPGPFIASSQAVIQAIAKDIERIKALKSRL